MTAPSRSVLPLVLTFLVALSPQRSFGAVGEWTNIGPDRGRIRALAIDPANPTTLYAGTHGGGVFKSTDSGGTWAAANTGLTYLSVTTLAIDPSASATLYAGTYGGVFKSTDSGGTWAAANTGLTNRHVTTLAVDPSASGTLYAGTYGGVFKSIDSGGTWAAASTGLGSPYVNALAIDPEAPATLYAGTFGPQVFKSTDAGSTWAVTGAGPNDPWGYGSAYALSINLATPATLCAGTDYGLFQSTDGGGNWTTIGTDLTSTVLALAIDPVNPGTLYAGTVGSGVFQSTDAGASWSAMNAGLTSPSVYALAIDPSTPARIYAATDAGVYEYRILAGGDDKPIRIIPPLPKLILTSTPTRTPTRATPTRTPTPSATPTPTGTPVDPCRGCWDYGAERGVNGSEKAGQSWGETSQASLMRRGEQRGTRSYPEPYTDQIALQRRGLHLPVRHRAGALQEQPLRALPIEGGAPDPADAGVRRHPLPQRLHGWRAAGHAGRPLHHPALLEAAEVTARGMEAGGIAMTSSSRSFRGESIRLRRKFPFLLPRSSRITASSSTTMRACRRETSTSSIQRPEVLVASDSRFLRRTQPSDGTTGEERAKA